VETARATGGHDRPENFEGPTFVPAPELESWLRSTFIEEGAPLRIISICATRRSECCGRRSRIRGDPTAMGAKARAELQVTEWFGEIPDFILTFGASYASICSDAQWCALCEHELSRCGVERDAFGAPKFRKSTGLPSFTLVGHDVEEFVGVVRRYGADATGV
jgi:hypothetical protein